MIPNLSNELSNASSKKEKILRFVTDHERAVGVVFYLILCFCLFFRLSDSYVGSYDEARHGVNAFEMIRQGNYISNFYNGEYDYWNLKPPLSYYAIMFGYRLFGYNTFGLRFYSAFSYFLLCILLHLFLRREFGKLTGLTGLAMLTGSYVLYFIHGVRTGDADSLFVLLYAASILALYLSARNFNWIHLTGLCFALCFLTKSWHAFIIAPAVFFYFIFTKGWKRAKWWQYFTFFLSCLIPIGIWALCRYRDDGVTFFREMVEYDLLNRSSDAIEGHVHSIFFYFAPIFENAPTAVCFLLSLFYLIYKLVKRQKFSDLSKLCLCAFIPVFLIYSIAKTRIHWYAYPLYVPLYLAGAVLLARTLTVRFSIPDLWRKKNADGTETPENPVVLHRWEVVKKAVLGFFWIALAVSVIVSMVGVTGVVYQAHDIWRMQDLILDEAFSVPADGVVFFENQHDPGRWQRPEQGQMLWLEWKTSVTRVEEGGWEAFAAYDGQAYILVDEDTFSQKDHTGVEVVCGKYGVMLCRKTAVPV